MGTEIERKFLVHGEPWQGLEGTKYLQGYICSAPERTIRIRIAGQKAYITIKGFSVGISRPEYEYAIPYQDAAILLNTMTKKPLIEKFRYKIEYEGYIWDVDVFAGSNAGLVLAEIELTSPEQHFIRPPWLGEEVSHDPRYYNSNLATHPFK